MLLSLSVTIQIRAELQEKLVIMLVSDVGNVQRYVSSMQFMSKTTWLISILKSVRTAEHVQGFAQQVQSTMSA